MLSATFLALIVATIFLVNVIIKRFSWKNPPPGPKGLPFIGNIHQLDKRRSLGYSKWANEYGRIYKLNLVRTRAVVVSDYKLLKEMLFQSTFSGRPNFMHFDAIGNGDIHGLIMTDGPHWEELRRFTLRQLRDFGFGKSSLQDSTMVDVNTFLESLKKDSHKPIHDIPERLLFATVSSLWSIVTGERLDSERNHELLEVTKIWRERVLAHAENGMLVFFPELNKLMPEWSGYNEVRKVLNEIVSIVTRHVPEHKSTYDGNAIRDFTDVYLSEMKKAEDPNSAFQGVIGERHIIGVMWDLYLAGTDTTSNTLSWMTLYLSKMPEIQRKFQAEIEEITNGNSRQVELSDRPNMPYTEALLSEVLRKSTVVPQAVFHRAVEDTEVDGYHIPKDTLIIPNVYHVHSDPKVWGDPENFRPERFLSPDGTKFKKSEALIPFGIGRRQCLGESLARDTLFLFGTNMFQKFCVEFDKNGPDNGFEAKETFIVSALPYNVILKERV